MVTLLAAMLFWLCQEPRFSTDVKVVNVLATVRDKDGKIVHNLTKDDFTLEEEGRPQTIRYFAQQTDLPLTLGLLVDISGSQRRVLEAERGASYSFLEQVLREAKDMAFIIQFDGEVELLQDLTSARKDLESALGQVKGPEPGTLRRRDQTPGRRRRGGTALYDAVLLAADELMRKQPGRKALIVLSDGVDMSSRVSITEAIEAAQRSDTLVYAIRFFDERARGGFPGFPGGRRGGDGRIPDVPDGKKILERIAKETGGGYFEVSGKQPITRIFSRIEEELRNQYNLGYTSDTTNAAEGFRKIRVTTKKRGLVVQARDGYYGGR